MKLRRRALRRVQRLVSSVRDRFQEARREQAKGPEQQTAPSPAPDERNRDVEAVQARAGQAQEQARGPAQDAGRERFLRDIEGALILPAHVDPAEAASAVTCTLTARLTGGEAQDMLQQLPLSLRPLLQRCERHVQDPAAAFDRDEFVRRVADHLGVSQGDAECIALAVFSALRARLPAPDVQDVDGQLPKSLKELWRAAVPGIAAPASGEPVPMTPPAGHFIFGDIERSGALPQTLSATQAFAAVMCTLMQRMEHDEGPKELAQRLPLSVRHLVDRCALHREQPGGEQRWNAAEFVQRVAEHLNTDLDSAEEITRAVFSAVQRLMSSGERGDVARELPEDLQGMWREPDLRQ